MDKIHSDFDLPWCKQLLTSPTTSDITISERTTTSDPPEGLGTMLFYRTLYTDYGIRAQVNFRRTPLESDAIGAMEWCCLFSLGDGLDGKKGRLHGGFSSLILDHMTGWCAAQESQTKAPSTATLTVDYKAPIDTPGIILCRAWLVEKSGRKLWARGRIQDREGKVMAEGKALFVTAKESKI